MLSNNQLERESWRKRKGMHFVRRKIKWPTATSVIFLFLTVAPLRAKTLSTRRQASSRKGIAQILPQSFAASAAVAHSIAVCLDGEALSFWSDGDDEDKDKKNNDKDDRVPEPGVILQLALGLLGVGGLRLILKPQESNAR